MSDQQARLTKDRKLSKGGGTTPEDWTHNSTRRTTMVDDPLSVLNSLRWSVDQKVFNCFDEHVWLGPCFDRDGKRIGITDCCFVEDPCERHRAMQDDEDAAALN